MNEPTRIPTVAIIGKKNSGKTSVIVAVAAELRRRGYRVASLKHGHHEFEMDQPGTDSWRHFHEGEVEAVLFVASGRMALISRLSPEEEPTPGALIERHLSGGEYDLILVEGFKFGDLPKIEIHRAATGQTPIYDAADPVAAALFLAVVTDDPTLVTGCPTIPLDPDNPAGSHAAAIVDLLTDMLPRRGDGG